MAGYIKFLTVFSDQLVFAMDTDPDGKELWYSDGTPEGTRMLTGYNDTNRSQNKDFNEAVMFEGYLYAVIRDDQFGTELWISNGTRQGTHVFMDLIPGVQSSNPSNLTVIGDYLYFLTDGDGLTGNLWRTDGTVEGTIQMEWNYPELFKFKEVLVHKGDLFFVASHPEYGQALFKYDLGGISGKSDELRVTSDLEVFPNPATDILNIRCSAPDTLSNGDGRQRLSARIYTVHGQLVNEVGLTGEYTRVSVSDFLSGIYFIRVKERAVKCIKN